MASETLTCQTCNKTWDRQATRGRKPKLCDDCRDNPVQLKKKKALDTAEIRRIAGERIDNLERNLKSRNNHISQPQPRRSYVISEIEERIRNLELWREEVEQQKAETGSEEVRKRSGSKQKAKAKA